MIQRVYILANGEGTRWGNYMGTDKQLLEIEGEKLLYRTVRLLKENGIEDIVVIGKYDIDGTRKYLPNKSGILDKFHIDTSELYGIQRYALLYGDCYYSEKIIKDLVSRDNSGKKWLHWTCNRPNMITGKPYPEGYIHAIYNKNWWDNKCRLYEDMVSSGKIDHQVDWVFLRYILKLDLYVHEPELMKDNEVDWEDETDDFDYPHDYKIWMKNVKGIEI